jgi:hypothetical protein
MQGGNHAVYTDTVTGMRRETLYLQVPRRAVNLLYSTVVLSVTSVLGGGGYHSAPCFTGSWF